MTIINHGLFGYGTSDITTMMQKRMKMQLFILAKELSFFIFQVNISLFSTVNYFVKKLVRLSYSHYGYIVSTDS